MVSRKESLERRVGRGFSRGELKEAGITLKQAMKIAVAVDARRRSIHSENVKLLKTQLESLATAEKRVPKPKKARRKAE